MSDLTTDRHWHLDKRVNAGHILTTIVILLAGVGVVHKLDTRLTAAEVRLDAVQQQHLQYQQQTAAALVRIEAKLDRVIEREAQR